MEVFIHLLHICRTANQFPFRVCFFVFRVFVVCFGGIKSDCELEFLFLPRQFSSNSLGCLSKFSSVFPKSSQRKEIL